MADRTTPPPDLPAVARQAIHAALTSEGADQPVEDGPAAATFVSVSVDGRLRGCIGSLRPRRGLIADVRANAVAAATRDRRFAPLTTADLDRAQVAVSVLSALHSLGPLTHAQALAALRPGVDGVVLEHQGRRATFLPAVWSNLPDPALFLAALLRKAGLPEDFWDDGIELSRYTVQTWTDPPVPQPPGPQPPATDR